MSQLVSAQARLARRLLLLLCAVLLLVVAALHLLSDQHELVAPRLNAPLLPSEDVLSSSMSADPEAVTARPLFWPERRPPDSSPAPVDEPKPQASAEGIRLLGIIIEDGRRFAIVAQNEDVQRVTTGDKVGDWTIGNVAPGLVELLAGNERVVLNIKTPVATGIRLEPN